MVIARHASSLTKIIWLARSLTKRSIKKMRRMTRDQLSAENTANYNSFVVQLIPKLMKRIIYISHCTGQSACSVLLVFTT